MADSISSASFLPCAFTFSNLFSIPTSRRFSLFRYICISLYATQMCIKLFMIFTIFCRSIYINF